MIMENKMSKYYPLGTVVSLFGGTKRIMIIGFAVIPLENPDIMYDYTGVVFPEGILVNNKNMLFNHEQIEKVYHFGLIDDEEKAFKANLQKYLEENYMGTNF